MNALDRFSVHVAGAVLRHRTALLSLVLLGLTIGWMRPIWPIMKTWEGLVLSIAAIAPITIVMLVVRRLDPTSLEPLHLLFRTYLLGMGLAVLTAMVNTQMAYLPTALLYILIVGPGEEAVKMLAVRVMAYKAPAFDDIVDGIVYGVAAGAGFAAIENLAYVITAGPEAWQVVAARTLLSVPNHVLWAALGGYYLARARFDPGRAPMYVAKGLMLAAGAHALYDVIVTQTPAMVTIPLVVLLDILIILHLRSQIRGHENPTPTTVPVT